MSARPHVGRQGFGQGGAPPLSRLYFYLTGGCNLACRHCWLPPKSDADGSGHAMLPVELFETAIRQAKPLGLKMVKLTGGEPLLHPEFTRLLEIVRREELAVAIETNGLLCSREMAAEIAKSPRRFVAVSIDGASAESHDWMRGVAGSFESACQAVRNLSGAGIAPQVTMSLTRRNADELDAVVRMAEGLGASSVKFNLVQPIGRGEQLHETGVSLDVVELVRLGRHVEMELASTTKLQLFFDYPLAFRGLSRIANGDGCRVCTVLSVLGIIPSGHYALCGIGEHVAELVFGLVGQDQLQKVWQENGTLQALRAGLPGALGGICARCLVRGRCLGSCIAQNYYRTGSLWAPFWLCEQAEESGVFPASRLSPALRHGGGAEEAHAGA